MAYAISQQRRNLENQLDDILRKLRIASKKDVPIELRDFAIAAAIFLAHAEIENFFVDILDGLARAYSVGAAECSKLPSKLRAHLIFEKFGLGQITAKLHTKAGEQEIFGAIEKWFVSPNLRLITGASPTTIIAGSDIYGDYTYPSVKNIERILRRIGVGDPKGTLNSVGKGDVVGLLESVASLRTALAHSAVLPGVSIGDVVARLNQLRLFVRAFDRVLYSNARTSISHEVWVASLC